MSADISINFANDTSISFSGLQRKKNEIYQWTLKEFLSRAPKIGEAALFQSLKDLVLIVSTQHFSSFKKTLYNKILQNTSKKKKPGPMYYTYLYFSRRGGKSSLSAHTPPKWKVLYSKGTTRRFENESCPLSKKLCHQIIFCFFDLWLWM